MRSEDGLRHLDALIFPSRHALEEHRSRGLGASVAMVHLPYFLPDGWARGVEDERPAPVDRPYLAAAGRLVKMKGFERLIPMMRYLPEADLRIAGTGPFEPELRKMAADLSNVYFEGLLGGVALARLFRGARAVVVPSLFPETFGYVVLEAFAVRTPVIVHEGGGAIYETGVQSGGGLGYRADVELLTAMRRMLHEPDLRDTLAARGYARRTGDWSEDRHLERYFDLVEQAASARRARSTCDGRCWPCGSAGRASPSAGRTSSGWIDLIAMKEPSNVPPGRPRLAGVLLAAATLLALAAACFARLAEQPTGLMVDPERPSVDYANRGDQRPVGNDLVFLFLPHHASIAGRIAQFGHWPVWDARGFGGRPMAGNPQAGMAYPPVWIAWWLRAPATLGWLTVAHLLWGGFGVYVLVRSIGAGRWAATIAAGIYQASPYLLAHTFEGHYPHVWAACWYAWAFWAYRAHREGRARGLLLVPILALTYLTGHPQEWLLLVMALTAWAVADAVRALRSRGSRRPAAGIAAWLALLALSIGMAAVDVAPQWCVRPWLRRSHDPALDAGIPHRYHLGGFNAFQLLSPTALGGPADYFGDDNYWESVFSIGLVPLVLAVVAVLRCPDRRLVRGWMLLAGLAVAFACGRWLGLYSLCYATVPGVGSIRVPARSLFLANLAGAVLAGLGIETLRTRMAGLIAWRRLAVRLAVVAAVVVGLLLFIQLRPVHRPPRRSAPAAVANSPRTAIAPLSPPSSGRTGLAAARVLGSASFWFAMGGVMVLAVVGCRPIGDRGRRVVVGLIGLVALGELGWCGYSLIRVAPAERFVGPDPVSAAIERLGARMTGPQEGSPPRRPPVRIKARDTFYGDLPACLHGIEKTNVDDAFQLDRAAALYETLYPVASRVRPMAERLMTRQAKESWRRIRQAVFDRMSVAFVVSDREESDPPWPVAAEGMWNDSGFVIQRNATAMPRGYVVPRATVLPDHRDVVLSSLAAIDPRSSVTMSVDPLAGMAPGLRASRSRPSAGTPLTLTDRSCS